MLSDVLRNLALLALFFRTSLQRDAAFEASRYPVDTYRSWVRRALTFLLPLAFITTFPAGVLTGQTRGQAVWAALVAPLTLALASWFWRFGVRHHSGASA
ncbi:MAG: ABC-2 family transporter protein [Phycisphaerae bacterium]|jgi:ABC-2 type transport system permease protein|nr:ABC-2 family transporter protein [Phycisphaerae bacterium]MCZ2400908.1 ABC-2 family transporter protein [Phycisphaerae bacterium]NUQ48917.1 ABC-2 family transporter protein [Phycisphaerae bacterium]